MINDQKPIISEEAANLAALGYGHDDTAEPVNKRPAMPAVKSLYRPNRHQSPSSGHPSGITRFSVKYFKGAPNAIGWIASEHDFFCGINPMETMPELPQAGIVYDNGMILMRDDKTRWYGSEYTPTELIALIEKKGEKTK